MKTFLLSLLLVLTTACSHRSQPTSDTVVEPRQYSLDEDIGAMLLVGFRGTSIDEKSSLASDLKRYYVGSVILFDYDAPSGTRGRNIKSPAQLKNLCRQLRSINPQMLIGIDQEGGAVSRLAKRYGFESVMSARKSAELGMDTVRHCAALTAKMLAEVGIDVDFAPVADVDVNPACPVIGGMARSFSANERVVADCCNIWVEELQRRHIVACMKHFPGHGSATGDTHKGLVDVTNTWQEREMNVYKEVINGLSHRQTQHMMIMTAHVVNRQLDAQGLPASLSESITALLRDSLAFDGVIVTDDLVMGAISNHYSLRQTLKMAINAGADLLCLSNNGSSYDEHQIENVVAIITQMVADGEVSEQRVRQAAQRVRQLSAW
ncbi:MAG: hypothetical protein IJ761_05410 [Bacteroidales bacterium]|nr:hypothetical protein [Bacteroidales bacterium]